MFWTKKKVKITKQAHAFKAYASPYNVGILNSFNPELQLKDTESVIKNSLIELLSELNGFRFVTTLILVLKKKRVKIKQSVTTFIQAQKQK